MLCIRSISVFLCLLAAISGRAQTPATRPVELIPGHQLRTIQANGVDRYYLYHLPRGYNPAKPTPVVLAFHGAGMNGGMMVGFSGLSRKSDEAGFVVVYPYGTGFGGMLLTFNAWANVGELGQPDDVLYTTKLLDDLPAVVNVDPKRIFVTGMSNGGMMCHRLAAEMPDRFAAIAPVGGTIAMPKFEPKRPVPIIEFHGTADRIVPYAGLDRRMPGLIKMRSVDETISAWVKINRCEEKPAIVNLPASINDGTRVSTETYSPKEGGADVVLVKVEGGGHTWPGQQPMVSFIGKSTRNISANDLLWDFFLKHPMK